MPTFSIIQNHGCEEDGSLGREVCFGAAVEVLDSCLQAATVLLESSRRIGEGVTWQAMKKRQDTKAVDIEKLYEVLDAVPAIVLKIPQE